MGKAFLCKSNGGGGGLAFRVLGGTSAPSSPKPNDIWVNTNEKITSYIFNAIEPEGYAQGMVWFSTDTSSTIEFNALKKNAIQVYPLSAKQYVSGAWVDKTAKSYQNGEWVAWWDGELFDNGNQYENITGGWTYEGYVSSSYAGSIVDGELQLYGKSGGFVTIGTKNAIDLTEYRYIEVTHKMISRGTSTKSIGVEIDQPKGTFKAYKEFTTEAGQTGTERLDVSSYDGEYFVLCYANNETACKGTVSKIKLIR